MNQRCYCMPTEFTPIKFPPVWKELRELGQLCDGSVSCEDGTVFQVHRAILAAVSPYFKALFTNSINRNQPENTKGRVQAPGPIFEKLLDYAYTGTCTVTPDNLLELMRYADQYEVLDVVQICCQYIIDNMEPENCLGLLRLSRFYFCEELAVYGRRYVLENFMEIFHHSDELVLLPFDELKDYLSQDELNVKTEEIVFEVIKHWIGHDLKTRSKYLLPLLDTLRPGNVVFEYLQKILDWTPVILSKECKSLITSAISTVSSLTADLDVLAHPFFRPRVPHEILFVIGGWTNGSPTNFMETYDTRADKWILSTYSDEGPRAYHGVCSLDNKIYIIGGFDGTQYFSSMRCFDPATYNWRNRACMHNARCYVSVTTHDENIYAIGGFNGHHRMNSMERYDADRNQWELVKPMHCQRSDASATTLNDKIYIVGGFNGLDVLNTAEVYDIDSNQWTLIPAMISPRSGVSLIGHKGKLFAFGGFNGFTRLVTAESYTPGNSAGWVGIGSMYFPRSNFATVVLDGFIFAIGGFSDRFMTGSATINNVECYDADTNEWLEAAPMNSFRSALSACVISGLPNGKEYSMLGEVIRKQDISEKSEE